MHVLFGLKNAGFEFELKGGTSLSKGFRIIDRFSEDIDIHIMPPVEMNVNPNPKNTNPKTIAARKDFYDWLSVTIKIDGILSVERDCLFDEVIYYRSGGIRLRYKSKMENITGIKEGILLEAGFDTVTPNIPVTISSWAYDRAKQNNTIHIIDNRARDIPCYHPGYTLVEKLQTIATKFRQEQEDKISRPNLMRQYYDVYCLLGNDEVQRFINTSEYNDHKKQRFLKKTIWLFQYQKMKHSCLPVLSLGEHSESDMKQPHRFITMASLTLTYCWSGSAQILPDFEAAYT